MWSMRQDDDYRRGRPVVAALEVHLAFVTKYPRGVLPGEHLGILGLVNSLKGVWARRLRQHYWVRTHREHLWSPLYFAASAGGAPPETLRAYIRQQRTFGRPG
jgi:REP element-mobilizing transposase RayT